MKPHTATEPRSSISGWIFAAVLFTLVACGTWFAVNRYNIAEYRETYKNREVEITEIANLKQRINQLKRKQQSLSLNGVESEKQIRERLGMHKPGERVIFLVDEPEESTTASTQRASGTLNSATESPADDAEQRANQDTAEDEPASTLPPKIRSAYDAM